MDNNNSAYLESLINDFQKKYFKQIEQDVIDVFKDAINQTIYFYYSPTHYERTYRFRDSVRCKYDHKENTLYVFSDINEGMYFSAVDGRDISSALNWFLQEGHKDNTGINNQYHNYESRNFLEKAEELLKSKYSDLKITIINKQPSIV